MKKCLFTIAVDDAENFGDNEKNVLEIKMVNGKLLAPVCSVEGENIAQIKNDILEVIDNLFSSKLE